MSRKKTEPKTEKVVVEVGTEDVVITYQTTQRRNLKEVVDKVLIISGVDIRTGRRGEFAIITATPEDEMVEQEFYTFSKPVVTELKKFENIFKQGKKLKVRICYESKKSYMYLCPP